MYDVEMASHGISAPNFEKVECIQFIVPTKCTLLVTHMLST
jgi:hypothetical protein